MIAFNNIGKIYMAQGFTDLRKGIDGYTSILRIILSSVHLKMSYIFFAIAKETNLKASIRMR